MMVMVVRVAPAPDVPAEHGGSDGDDEDTRREREPRVEVLGEHPGRQPERHEPEREHARGVRDRDGEPEQHRVGRRAAGADEIRGHHALAVARRQRVQRAPSGGGEQQQHEHTATGGGVRQQRGEARVGSVRRRGPQPLAGGARRGHRAAAGSHRQGRLAHVGRAGEQRLRIAAQAVGQVLGGRRGPHRGPRAGAHDDRPPADADRRRPRRAGRPARHRPRAPAGRARCASCAARPDRDGRRACPGPRRADRPGARRPRGARGDPRSCAPPRAAAHASARGPGTSGSRLGRGSTSPARRRARRARRRAG